LDRNYRLNILFLHLNFQSHVERQVMYDHISKKSIDYFSKNEYSLHTVQNILVARDQHHPVMDWVVFVFFVLDHRQSDEEMLNALV
jgi:hypothetical protein